MKMAVYLINCYGNFQAGDKEYQKYLDGCLTWIMNKTTDYDINHINVCGGFTKDHAISEAETVCQYINRRIMECEINVMVEPIEQGKNASGNIYYGIKCMKNDADFFVFSDNVHFAKNTTISKWVNKLHFSNEKRISNVPIHRADDHPLHKKMMQNIQMLFYILFGFLLVPFDIYGGNTKQMIRNIIYKDVTKTIALITSNLYT